MSTAAYSRYVFLQVLIGVSILWAVVGSFVYDRALQYLGWQTIGFELRVTLFLCFTIGGAGIVCVVIFGFYRLFRYIRND